LALRYHPAAHTLSTRDQNGMVVIWHRPRILPLPPALDLRVNYGHDWVESFYEAGHIVWITVTESDGATVKATAEVVTEPKDFWGGETGFQTRPEDWDPAPPDIQPYNWVYGWVDNGANAQVQIGEINGMIDLEAESIEGTITAPWFSDEVNVECHPWGAPEPQPGMKFDTVQPDGEDTYSCSWAEEWDIQAGQDVGVGYFGPDGHWVANAFQIPNPEIRVWLGNQRIEGYRWPLGVDITLSIYDPSTGATYSDTQQAGGDPDWSFVQFLPSDFELLPGQEVTMTGGGVNKSHIILPVSITSVDSELDVVAGTASGEGRIILCIYDGGCDPPAEVFADVSGHWQIDYSDQFDIRPGFGMDATEFDEDGDGTSFDYWVPNPRFTVFPEWEYVEGWEWLDGAMVTASVSGKPECTVEGLSGYPEWDPWTTFVSMGFPEGCDVMAGDVVTLTNAAATRKHLVQNLAVTGVDMTADTVEGIADPGAQVHVWPHEFGEYELQPTAGEDGSWLADFTSLGFDLQEGMCGRAEIRDEAGNATAVDWCVPPPPRILVQITDNWFEAQNFTPNAELTFGIYDSPGGTQVMTGTMQTDDYGTVGIWVGDNVDLIPGNYLVVSDEITTKDLLLEALTFDVLDLTNGHAEGTAPEPYGRLVWVGIGFEGDGWSMEVFTTSDGSWVADFGAPVPADYQWVAAQVFDEDGDASEVRPSEIINGQP
jgi:hypothetical protein